MSTIQNPSELRVALQRLLNDAGPGVSRRRFACALRSLADRIARSVPYPEQDIKGSGEWTVYFETDGPKTIHRWKFRSQTLAVQEATKAQKEHGGYVTVMHKGREVNEVGPGGKVKSATVANVVARYMSRIDGRPSKA